MRDPRRELRTCPVTGRVVLINADWIDAAAPAVEAASSCWHCAYAGPVIARLGDAVAVPHPVPALGVEGDPRLDAWAGSVRRQAVGAHELIFSHHDSADGELLELLAHRMHDLRRDTRLRGFAATRRHAPGAHVAWQLFALPYALPPSQPGGWRDAERAHGERLLADAEGVTTLLAWAPRVPFETWILPSAGLAGFEASGLRAAMSAAIADALGRIRVALRDPPVDVVLVDGEPWRVELLPRLGEPAPVEVATGAPVHGVFPEAAAEYLRDLGSTGVAR